VPNLLAYQVRPTLSEKEWVLASEKHSGIGDLTYKECRDNVGKVLKLAGRTTTCKDPQDKLNKLDEGFRIGA